MKMLKKYINLFGLSCLLATFFIAVDAKNPITKKSIRQARQIQQLQRTYPKNFARSVRYGFKKKIRRNNQSQGIIQIKQSHNNKNNGATQNQEIKHKIDNASLPVKQEIAVKKEEINEQNRQIKPIAQSVNTEKKSTLPKIPVQKTEPQPQNRIVPTQKDTLVSLSKNNEISSLDKTKFLIGDDSLPNEIDMQKKESEDLHDKENDTPVDGQNGINIDAEVRQKTEFLKQLSQLSPDKLEQVFEKMHLNDVQRKEIKEQLDQLPTILKNLEDDLQNPNSRAGQAMQGKGWVEWFRTDLLNYPWAKTGTSLLSTVWNYTGGALLKRCRITFSKETKKETYDGTFLLIHTFLEAFGLDTPGGVLDSFFMTTLYSYFPTENTWSGTFAKTAFAIGYFGTIRGMPKRSLIWKGIEAFLCTSYCKYFAQDNADYLRISLLQWPINLFYHYIPEAFKNRKIEWLISQNKCLGSYKYLTSLIGMGSILASIAMSTSDQQPKIVQ
ncbi:MAG TPA: hypothetical protein VL201_03970 [Patescibacteria group bacterium]|nr:hypothetical protein [Patescibacteria group bacterium]